MLGAVFLHYRNPVSRNLPCRGGIIWWIWCAGHTENKVNSVLKRGGLWGMALLHRPRCLQRSGRDGIHSAGFTYRAQPVDFMRNKCYHREFQNYLQGEPTNTLCWAYILTQDTLKARLWALTLWLYPYQTCLDAFIMSSGGIFIL